MQFHDEQGIVPYIKRLCSGTANTGDIVCLPGWKTAPQVQVSINTLSSYYAAQVAQNQQWSVYYDHICCYNNGGLDYGYQFQVHALLRLASGQGTECLKQVAWGTSVCTESCTCSVKVRSKFCMWCNGNAPSNFYAGCLCYVICYRVAGAGSYCCCLGGTPTTYSYLQPSSSQSELQSISEQTQTLNLPCMAIWEILTCCTGLCWHDTGICATTTQCCVCTRTFTGGTSCVRVVNLPGSCCCQLNYAITGNNPICVYCNQWRACWCSNNSGTPTHICLNGTAQLYLYFGPSVYTYARGQFTLSSSSSCIRCCCSPSYICWTPVGENNICYCCFNFVNCVTGSAGSVSSNVCFLGGDLTQCYCVNSGNAASCCLFCNHSVCDTFGCYCVLDGSGVLNWLSVAYG